MNPLLHTGHMIWKGRTMELSWSFGLGGGTFDVPVLEVGNGVFEVLSASAYTHLGGDVVDKRIVDWLVPNFKRKEGIDLFERQTNSPASHRDSRESQSGLCSDLLDRLRASVENSLREAKFPFKDLDELILVGGSTRISVVQDLVKRLTGKDPNVTVSLDEVFDLGAAVQTGILAGDVSDIVLWGSIHYLRVWGSLILM